MIESPHPPRIAESRVGPRPGLQLTRRARERRGTALGFNLTPMIDVTFNLLIYFLVSSSFLRAEGFLPSRMAQLGAQASSPALPVTPIRLYLARTEKDDGVRMRLENTARIPRSFADLYQVLLGLRSGGLGFDASTPVVIHAEDEVAWDHVVNAFNAARRAGYESISFGQARRRG